MSTIKIPIDRLKPGILLSVIEEFVTRSGTDYGEREVPTDIKIKEVKHLLKTGLAVLLYDEETETCNIFLADDPVIRSMEG
jgi:uncharacterized protein YheU (UPF0270 family)